MSAFMRLLLYIDSEIFQDVMSEKSAKMADVNSMYIK